MNRTSLWTGKFPDILISDHVLSLPPPIRKFQTLDPRIGYRAAADIGRLEWHTRFMVPFETEVGVGGDEPFSGVPSLGTRGMASRGPGRPAREAAPAGVSATLAA